MEQWTRYQGEKTPLSPSLRKYNVNDYVCFVCHIKTYRKRIRALRVMVSPSSRVINSKSSTQVCYVIKTQLNGEPKVVSLWYQAAL